MVKVKKCRGCKWFDTNNGHWAGASYIGKCLNKKSIDFGHNVFLGCTDREEEIKNITKGEGK